MTPVLSFSACLAENPGFPARPYSPLKSCHCGFIGGTPASLPLLFLIRDEIFARCQPLERQPQAQIVKHQALQLASQDLSRVTYRERRLLQDLPRDLPGTRQELIARHHLAD